MMLPYGNFCRGASIRPREKCKNRKKINKNKQTKQIKMKFQNLLTGEIEGEGKKIR
jgi:hypothetical protein